MSFNNKLKALFSTIKSVFEEMAAIATETETLYLDGELAVGTAVFNEGGPAPSGEYFTEDKIIVVKDGLITDIRDREPAPTETTQSPEPAKAPEEMGCAVKKNLEDETPKIEPDPQVEPQPEPPVEPDKFDEITNRLDLLATALDELAAKITVLDSRITDLENSPEGKLPKDEFHRAQSDASALVKGVENIKNMRNNLKIR